MKRILLYLLLFFALHSNAANTVVATSANTAAAGVSSFVTSTAINSTLSTGIIVYINSYKPSPVGTLTDNYGNTYTLRNNGSSANDGNSKGLQYDCLTPTVGPGFQVTYTTTGASYLTIQVVAAYGTSLLPSTIDQTAYNAPLGAATTGGGGSITPTSGDALIISFISPTVASAYSPSQPTGYTLVGSFPFATGFANAMAYQLQSTPTTTNPVWSWSTSSYYSAGTVSYILKAPTALPPAVSGSFTPMFNALSQ